MKPEIFVHAIYSRTSKLPILLMFAILLCCSPQLKAAAPNVITVTSTANTTNTPGVCTLRDAINSANDDVARGGCAAGNGADVIELPANATFVISTFDNRQFGNIGLPRITTDITINGNGSTIQYVRLPIFNPDTLRFFYNNEGVHLTLNNLKLQDGYLGTFFGIAFPGGAIFNDGILTANNCTFIGNHAGEGFNNTGGDGGAIYNSSTGTLIINLCSFITNFAGQGGGSSSHQALSGGRGGAIFNDGGIVQLIDTLFSGNKSGDGAPNPFLAGSGGRGGALYSELGQILIQRCTFKGNIAGSGGSGSINGSGGHGGAVYYHGSNLMTVVNSTFAGNSAGASDESNTGQTGGLFSIGPAKILNCTFSGNSNGNVNSGAGANIFLGSGNTPFTHTVSNTIVVNSPDGPNCLLGVPSLITGTNNMSDTSDCFSNFTLQTKAQLNLGILQNNDGPAIGGGNALETIELKSGSTAINAGNDTVCRDALIGLIDERGYSRAFGSHCDIGAFEFNPCPTIKVSPATIDVLTVGSPVNLHFSQTGSNDPIAFSLGGGTLPDGISLQSDGTFSGTPSKAGTFNFTVAATSQNSCSGSQSYTLTVNCPTIGLPSTTFANGTFGANYSAVTLTPTGGTAPYQFTVSGLPTGMNFTTAADSVTIGGTPRQTGTFNIVVAAIDNFSCRSSEKSYALIINKADPIITWNNPANILYGTRLGSAQLNATANVDGLFDYTPALNAPLDAANGQKLSVIFKPTDSTNYNSVSKNVQINVLKAPLTVVANNVSRNFGDPNPALTGSITGIQYSDPITATFSTTATPNSPIGNYPITITLNDPNNRLVNYNVTTTNGIFTVKPVLDDGIYTMKVTSGNKCIQPQSSFATAGVKLVQNTCSGGSEQKWQLQHLGDNIYRLTNVATGMVAETAGGLLSDFAPVDQSTWTNASHQKWLLRKVGGAFELVSINSNLLLEVLGIPLYPGIDNSTINGVTLDQHSATSTTNQRFIFQ